MSGRVTLTEAEREALGMVLAPLLEDDSAGPLEWHRCPECPTRGPCPCTGVAYLGPEVASAVERILSDRLADAWPCAVTWVCDTCMLRVHRDQVAVWADGEHIICQWCRRDEAEVEALRATVGRVEALHQRGELRPMKPWCRECGQHYPCPTVRALGGGPS